MEPPPELLEVRRGPKADGYEAIGLVTAAGTVEVRYSAAPAARGAVVWVGGIGGGWDTPAAGLYPRLAAALVAEGLASVRVRFRSPGDLDACTHDVRAALAFLAAEGVGPVALVGHSFGAAVVIRAAAEAPQVRAVVTISAQGYGAGAASTLGPRCAVLLVHGAADPILPAASSRALHAAAAEPRRLVLIPGGDHVLDADAEAVEREVREWLRAWVR
jgi:pimeloyl-ACP methyl ester carboxylesterase